MAIFVAILLRLSLKSKVAQKLHSMVILRQMVMRGVGIEIRNLQK